VRRCTDLEAWRGAWWAHRALRSARKQLRDRGIDGLVVPAPRHATARAERGVNAVLRRVPLTCLERAVVLQTWRAALDDPREVVIGVRPGEQFVAHAWLDGENDPLATQFHELMRLPPAGVA
jgi:hypothetical protein